MDDAKKYKKNLKNILKNLWFRKNVLIAGKKENRLPYPLYQIIISKLSSVPTQCLNVNKAKWSQPEMYDEML